MPNAYNTPDPFITYGDARVHGINKKANIWTGASNLTTDDNMPDGVSKLAATGNASEKHISLQGISKSDLVTGVVAVTIYGIGIVANSVSNIPVNYPTVLEEFMCVPVMISVADLEELTTP
jgi:hypothetical protein